MSRELTLGLARSGRLYPAVILHGATAAAREQLALELARTLLCAAAPAERPCGRCRHCARIAWPGANAAAASASREDSFHPDFRVLQRDEGRIGIGVEAARALLTMAQTAPFEARGQVFIVAGAETLTAEAANALLKILEEPPVRAPRHFLLLAPSRMDLLPTLRSRSLPLYLGPAEALDPECVQAVSSELERHLAAHASTGGGLHLLQAAAALSRSGDFRDPRSTRPFGVAAAAVLQALRALPAAPAALRRGLLELAEALLEAPELRLRGIPADRILDGLVARYLGGGVGVVSLAKGPPWYL